jgi:ferredoxin--NADP+ reductase
MSSERPIRVAVVGSGPAGFYAAGALLAADAPIEVDMLERLPTPWGLVRLGVAPDHPKIKSVSRAFEKIAERPGFRFFGNVEIGKHVTHDDLLGVYDAIVYTVGAQTDRRMGIPGEDLPGSWPATAFVAWYNGHPDFQDLPFDLASDRAVVVGAGNVAVDVARMLALTDEDLRATDTTDPAIEAIVGGGLSDIVMLARRGPAQAAFTTPELQELGELKAADIVVDPADLELDPASEAALAGDTNAQRNVELLRKYATRPRTDKPKALRLRFCVSPVAILGEERVEAVEIVRNELVADEQGRVRAVPTDEREVIPCGLVLRSVGYLGTPLPGVPFDEATGTMPNRSGRVVDERGEALPGVYCAGWIKRGPSGVIGTNKKDATETVELLLEDARAGKLPRLPDATPDRALELMADSAAEHVTYAGWQAIDVLESSRGSEQGRPRVKLCTWDELLEAARAAAAVSQP